MAQLEMQSIHPYEHKEVVSLSARFLTAVVLGLAGILSLAPFIAYYLEH